jgi:hypothetical protein
MFYRAHWGPLDLTAVVLRAALACPMSTPSKFNGHLIAGVPISRYCGSG